MPFTNTPSKLTPIVNVNCGDRWTVYHRLQELHIWCECSANQPLQVHLTSPLTVIQIWSVLKHTRASRPELVHWLNRCWHAKGKHSA